MDYEKLHNETLQNLQEMVSKGKITEKVAKGICADFVAENEDEKIRKELIEHIEDMKSSFIGAPDCRDRYEEEELEKYNRWLTWLKSLKERMKESKA